VQVVHKRGRQVLAIEHIGSAHDEAALAVLLVSARERAHVGQGELALDVAGGRPRAGPRVVATPSLLLWEALAGVYTALGFDAVGDQAFRSLVLGRIIEPTSKIDTLRVLAEVGVPAPSPATVTRCIKRVTQRDYRAVLSDACFAHVTSSGTLALVLYDVTTLYFEVEHEDSLRKVGMSKERRVDPQVSVGLLCDRRGFPLAVHLFEGNKAETKTLIPVLTDFRQRHPSVADIVVVADAGMLSAANLLALEEAGYCFIVGSRVSRAPYDLADHINKHGNYIPDQGTVETTRTMGKGAKARTRRVVYHYSHKRAQHDRRALNAVLERAEKVVDRTRPLKKDRFVKLAGTTPEIAWPLVERARSVAGIKGYVTNIPTTNMNGAAIVAAYRDLYEVERSFRMAKSDLGARPIFHHQRDSIDAHLTIVLAALAVSREAQQRTGLSIKKIVTTLRPLRAAILATGTTTTTADPHIPPEVQDLLNSLRNGH
jgi:hypothetical protein